MERPTDLGKLIVIGGPGGTGSSTIAKCLAQKWELHRVDAGEIMRNQDSKQQIEGYLAKIAIKHPEVDRRIDQFMVRMSYYPNILIEGKFFAAIASSMGIPCTIRMWVTCDLNTRVLRVIEREGTLAKGEKVGPESKLYQKTRNKLVQRQANDVKRIRKLYGVDLSKPQNFNDIVIDTTGIDVPTTTRKIFDEIKKSDLLRKRFSPAHLK